MRSIRYPVSADPRLFPQPREPFLDDHQITGLRAGRDDLDLDRITVRPPVLKPSAVERWKARQVLHEGRQLQRLLRGES